MNCIFGCLAKSLWYVRKMGLLAMALLSTCNCANPRSTSNQGVVEKSKPDLLQTADTTLQTSQKLAADLQAPTKLQAAHQALTAKFSCKPGHNTNPAFVGIQGMKDALRNQPGNGSGNLNKFIIWAKTGSWEQFGPQRHHYDWWMFPIDRLTAGQGVKYTVYQQDIDALKEDADWLEGYRLGAILLMQSWGWEIANCQPCPKPAPGQQWRNWDVRLGKLANPLILFEQWDLYDSLKAYVNTLRKQGLNLEVWVLNYFL